MVTSPPPLRARPYLAAPQGNSGMETMTRDEINRRLTTLHPTARRQLAAMTDTTYRGPHRIYRPTLSERFLSAVEHPAVATFAKVTFAGSVWFTGLAAAVVILLLIQGG